MIAALFVETDGSYFNVNGIDPWDELRDARKYTGPHPVIAHPPCHRWGRLGAVNYIRWGGEHNRPGNDHGCFYSAIRAVEVFGGVLEHPAKSHAWTTFGLKKPPRAGWEESGQGWVCEVWQSAYGHPANKATWLYYVGASRPCDLNWERVKGTCQIGFQDRRGKQFNKPTLSKKAANMTPHPFRDCLVSLVAALGSTAEISNQGDKE